jgi:hypothetical protein
MSVGGFDYVGREVRANEIGRSYPLRLLMKSLSLGRRKLNL